MHPQRRVVVVTKTQWNSCSSDSEIESEQKLALFDLSATKCWLVLRSAGLLVSCMQGVFVYVCDPRSQRAASKMV